ncbi:class I SAM-dependent methyltransferase [Afifella sp. JA880]|uniref:class I SAM-dependent methyltransferase n=1 Tax=Afifella sp. JA880 TaxID=2975280 RepID=UPI0021BB8AB8|nr:class I SAM-dependent methyltransferase [Afifella sp. JA880]MCT8268907.1 class I SAM-dependent methyltransferase [Afifella sp. JA880]
MIHLDSHPTAELSTPYDVFEGWVAHSSGGPLDLRLAGVPLAVSKVVRPDLGQGGIGFRAYVDLTRLDAKALNAPLPLIAEVDGNPAGALEVTIAPDLADTVAAARSAKLRKRDWLVDHLRHWQSREAGVEKDEALVFPQAGFSTPLPPSGAVNMLDPAYGFSGKLADKADGVSDHPYPSLLETQLAAARHENFMALDFGAGFKRIERPDVIYMEIFDYPSTDLLTVGQALPFADNTFDMVLTLAVLEHVDDPFTCAKEIVRVLKPGGLLFSGIPFMQPEHGYPDHYFNMTRSGHRRLYGAEIEVIEHIVDDHQHPFRSLQWILRSYMQGLPEDARPEFAEMSVRDILTSRYWKARQQPFVKDLSETAQFELASATTLIGRKRG